jgi:dolichol kinase
VSDSSLSGHGLLAQLVEHTRGPQPWRRLFHALNGLVIAAALTWLPLTRAQAAWLLGALLTALLVADFARLASPSANALFFRAFRRLVSPRELAAVASSTWYVAGILLAVVLFPRAAAVSGVLVLALADPLASYLGRRWGRRPFLGGTLEGSAIFLIIAAGILALRHPPALALLTAPMVTLVERRSWPLDDNFTVPLVCAGLLTALGFWL